MKRRTSALLVVVPVIVLADQLTKLVIQAVFHAGQTLTVIPGFFDLVLASNDGIAFGMFSGSPSRTKMIILATLTVAAIGLMLRLYFKESSRMGGIGLLMVVGGAVGNLIDRVVFGKVTDFLDFYYRDYHWPAFNLADSAITVGITLLILFDIVRPLVRARHRAPHPG